MAELDRRQFLVGTAGGAILLRLPSEASGVSKRALRELRSAVRGRVLLPRDSTRIVYNRRFEGLRPDAVVHVENTADVAAAVRWADRFDVRVVARSGGHSYAGYSSTGDGVVLDLSKLRGVRVAGGRATVGPGAQLIDVQRALTRRGLSVPSGSCPSVGIGGLALGGGHGLAGRRFGLTSDNLLAARVVTADGRVRHADADTNEDLFWACRGGGGGNFGIVTALTLKTHRAPGGTWFSVSWPWSQAEEALGGMAALRARGAARAHLDLLAWHERRLRPSACGRRGPVLRRPREAAPARAPADPRCGSEPQQRKLELLLARPSLGRLPRRRLRRVPQVHAVELLREVGLLRQPARAARAGRS